MIIKLHTHGLTITGHVATQGSHSNRLVSRHLCCSKLSRHGTTGFAISTDQLKWSRQLKLSQPQDPELDVTQLEGQALEVAWREWARNEERKR